VKVVGFVPSKLNSQRLLRKNVRPLAGRPLVNYCLHTLAQSGVDDTVVYASDPEILQYVEPGLPHRFVQRAEWLDTDAAKVQDFVGAFLHDVPCDVVVLLHITSPFISPATVRACIDAVASGEHESAFAALEFQRFAWFEGQPLNYRLDEPTPRTQDLRPVLVEQSGLYVFTADLFHRTQRRIAERPYIHVVDAMEGHDIDTAEEFELAELFIANRR
jgi:CMP-N-acetylneuraminic acid synthetase